MPTTSEDILNPTTTTQSNYLAIGEVQTTDIPWYLPSMPQPLQPQIQQFFESYVGLNPEEVISHIDSVRAKAWHIKPYPCIGMFTFIHCPMYVCGVYAEILFRVKNGGIFLDVGTAFGQELRCLVADGAPGSNMYAIDLSSDLWELGYLLFKDRARFDAKLIVADVLASGNSSGDLEALKAKVDVVHTGSFFHLFDWVEQAEALKRLVLLTRKGALVVGHQTGRRPAKCALIRGEPRFYHDEVSWRKMWSEVGVATNTTWILKVELGEHDILGLKQDDFKWMGPYARALRFVAKRT